MNSEIRILAQQLLHAGIEQLPERDHAERSDFGGAHALEDVQRVDRGRPDALDAEHFGLGGDRRQ